MMYMERSNWETQTSYIETVATSGQTVTARVEAPSPVQTAATDGHVTIYVANVTWMAGNTLAILSLPTPKTA